MKFGQLIECNMRNTFLEKTYGKCNGETIPRPFSVTTKLSAIKIYWNQVANSLLLPHIKLFLRNRRIFEEKYLSFNVLLTEQVSLPGCFYFVRYWVICFRNSLLTKHWHHKIWDNLSIQAYMAKKFRQKFKYLEKKKSITISFFERWKSDFESFL